MKSGGVTECFSKVMVVANKMQIYGEDLQDELQSSLTVHEQEMLMMSYEELHGIQRERPGDVLQVRKKELHVSNGSKKEWFLYKPFGQLSELKLIIVAIYFEYLWGIRHKNLKNAHVVTEACPKLSNHLLSIG
ncbi:hypothetical protein SDJN03_16443, partial [Cucurbita argyrosperma subsp. sororia]